jgi:uncharacterized protein
MIMLFSDPGSGFFDTPEDAQSLVLRPKDMQDNAIPSGNSMACEALLRLGALTDRGDYRDRAEAQLKFVGEAAIRYPTAFARWLSAADFAVGQVKQVAVLGEAEDETFKALIKTVRSEYRPNVVVAASPFPPAEAAPHLLKDRPLLDEKPTAYVCEGFVCRQPVTAPGHCKTSFNFTVPPFPAGPYPIKNGRTIFTHKKRFLLNRKRFSSF